MMSRWNDPRHLGGYNANWGLTPWGSNFGPSLLDTFFDDVDFTPRIRDHAGQLQVNIMVILNIVSMLVDFAQKKSK